MSYTPNTDFLALARTTSGGVRFERMPGLDFTVAALARAGLITLSVGQSAPTSNQSSTAWFQPASPTWSGEGVLFLWNAATLSYATATPALWAALLASGPASSFQSVPGANATVLTGTSLLAVQRAAPVATALTLPSLVAQAATGRDLEIVDWSSGVTNHLITLTPPDGATIMRQATWQLMSSAASLSGVRLRPSIDLNGWVIAP